MTCLHGPPFHITGIVGCRLLKVRAVPSNHRQQCKFTDGQELGYICTAITGKQARSAVVVQYSPNFIATAGGIGCEQWRSELGAKSTKAKGNGHHVPSM